MSDVISREAAIEAALRVRDVAKTLNLLEMAMGAAKCADDLRTLPDAPAVKVKQLGWRDSFGVLRAETPFGDYKVAGKVLHHLGSPSAQAVFESIEHAKAAAQADYEARILAALEGGDA